MLVRVLEVINQNKIEEKLIDVSIYDLCYKKQ